MWQRLSDWFMRSRWGFEWRYLRNQTPWDTGVTPPEVMEFLSQHPPGRALDLGCGTGTNAVTLARHGWLVTGVDFSPKAIAKARKKAAASGLSITFYVADVTNLSMLQGPYDYVLDIGCLFALSAAGRRRYANELERLTAPQAWYMLYAWLPRPWRGGLWGLSVEEVEALFGAAFTRERYVIGEEKGHPSAWYWYRRK